MTFEQASQLIEVTRLHVELMALERDQFAEASRWLLFGIGGILGALVSDI